MAPSVRVGLKAVFGQRRPAPAAVPLSCRLAD